MVVGIALFLFFTLGQKQRGTPQGSAQERAKYNSAVRALAMEKKYLRSMAVSLGVNYFSRHSGSSTIDHSFFMFNRISQLANKWGVELISFSPEAKEEKGVYTKISFAGAISATYPETVSFFQDLEEKEKLLIDNILVTTTSQSPLKHQVQFTLSCFEFTDQLLANLQDTELISSPSSPENKIMAASVKRDPFFNPFETPEGYPQAGGMARTEMIDLSGELSLTGIITFPQPETAIIDHTVLKKGEKIHNKEIIEIKKEHVILKEGEQLYILKLKEAAPQTMINVNPLEQY